MEQHLIDLPFPPGLWSIVSYIRKNESGADRKHFDFCMSEGEQSAIVALLLFDNNIDQSSVSVNGIPFSLSEK